MESATDTNFAPLAEFYERQGRPFPPLEILPGEDMSQPYRQLLVHDADMTGTLEKYHKQSIYLRMIDSRANGTSLDREVVLVGAVSRAPVEFGAIRINLEPFPAEWQAQIRECYRPLGSILSDCDLGHECNPSAYFHIKADLVMMEAFGLAAPLWLYGRCNVLTDRNGNTLAQVVEILPPLVDGHDEN